MSSPMSPRTPAPAARRTYSSSRRAQQAAQTRDDVIGAATELFGTLGWAATTVAAIAARAGVAVETVYKSGGAKAALLRAAMEAAVVGDTDDTPLAERPEYQKAIGEGELHARIEQSAAITATIHERSGGLWLAITEAAASDPKID